MEKHIADQPPSPETDPIKELHTLLVDLNNDLKSLGIELTRLPERTAELNSAWQSLLRTREELETEIRKL
jgi:hypothetical protein